MLKLIFSILLLANAALLAYQQGYLDTLLPNGREPGRMGKQLNADKITLTPAASAADAAAAAPAQACAEIGNFNAQEAQRFEAQLAPLSLGEKVSQHPVRETVSHMVYLPPQADKEAAEKKAAELRALGIDDFYIIRDNSSLRWAISLGVFKTEEAARTQLALLAQKGVRSARIGERTVNTSLVAFQLRGLDAGMKDSVEKIKAGFPKQELRDCETA